MKKFALLMLVLLIGIALFWFELAQYEPVFLMLGILLLITCIFALILLRHKSKS